MHFSSQLNIRTSPVENLSPVLNQYGVEWSTIGLLECLCSYKVYTLKPLLPLIALMPHEGEYQMYHNVFRASLSLYLTTHIHAMHKYKQPI